MRIEWELFWFVILCGWMNGSNFVNEYAHTQWIIKKVSYGHTSFERRKKQYTNNAVDNLLIEANINMFSADNWYWFHWRNAMKVFLSNCTCGRAHDSFFSIFHMIVSMILSFGNTLSSHAPHRWMLGKCNHFWTRISIVFFVIKTRTKKLFVWV